MSQAAGKTAFLFPGQGAQHVGMGRDLYEGAAAARRLFEEAEETSGLPLRRLCFEGPRETLDRTDVSQPAIFTVSLAALAALRELTDESPDFYAGLSLGEYTALVAAGSISFAEGLRLVTERGRCMQQAAEAVPGGMVSLIGADEQVAERVVSLAAGGAGVIVQANFNCPGQIVLSGTPEACRRALEVAKDCGASGAVALSVAGAFHSPLMAPAAQRLAHTLDQTDIRPPTRSVLANATARPHTSPPDIRRQLLAQLTSPVLWEQCSRYLLGEGVEDFLEIGPGRVLAGLMRRTDRRARVRSLNSLEAVREYAGRSAGAV